MNEDLKYLRLLSIGFYIYATIMALFSLIPVIHLSIGIALLAGAFPSNNNQPPPPAFFGLFFVVFASIFILCGMAIAACNLLAARSLMQHKRYIFCFVVAAIDCMFAPVGTVLGVFTIVVLLREPVKRLFNGVSQNELQPAISMTPPDWR
jgi:hypothetical protein